MYKKEREFRAEILDHCHATLGQLTPESIEEEEIDKSVKELETQVSNLIPQVTKKFIDYLVANKPGDIMKAKLYKDLHTFLEEEEAKEYEESEDETMVCDRLEEMSKFLKKFNNMAKTMERYKKKKFELKLKVDASQFIETLLSAFTLQITDDKGAVSKMQINDDVIMIRKVLEQIDSRHEVNQIRANRAIFPYLDSLKHEVVACFVVFEKKPSNPFRKTAMEEFCSSIEGIAVKSKSWKEIQRIFNNEKYIQIEYTIVAQTGRDIQEMIMKFEEKPEEHNISLVKGRLSHNSQNLFM